MKRNRDILRPILKPAKCIPECEERCKMQGDKLLINGTHYSINDLARLPPKLAAFKAVQKSDSESIVFHGELLLYSNFNYAPLMDKNLVHLSITYSTKKPCTLGTHSQ